MVYVICGYNVDEVCLVSMCMRYVYVCMCV